MFWPVSTFAIDAVCDSDHDQRIVSEVDVSQGGGIRVKKKCLRDVSPDQINKNQSSLMYRAKQQLRTLLPDRKLLSFLGIPNHRYGQKGVCPFTNLSVTASIITQMQLFRKPGARFRRSLLWEQRPYNDQASFSVLLPISISTVSTLSAFAFILSLSKNSGYISYHHRNIIFQENQEERNKGHRPV